MPFELRFAKSLVIKDKDQYLNECCFGGDVVLAEIEKASFLSDRANERVSRGQEDWGWFLWFWRGDAKFEVNICFETESTPTPEYRVHIIRQVKSGMFSKKMEDSKELESIKDEVKGKIEAWLGEPCMTLQIELE